MIDRFNRLLRWLSAVAAYVAAAALSVSVLVTVADIVLRRAINVPVTGVVDITQLAVMWAAFFAIPVAFHLDNHISVVMLTERLPARARLRVYGVGALVGAALLLCASLAAAAKGHQEYLQGDRSMILGIAHLWYWLPVVLGLALSAACAFGRSMAYLLQGSASLPSGMERAVDEQ